jgi:hypothetical protein
VYQCLIFVYGCWVCTGLRGGQIMCQQTGIIALSCGSASFSAQTTEHAQPVLQHKKSVLVSCRGSQYSGTNVQQL